MVQSEQSMQTGLVIKATEEKLNVALTGLPLLYDPFLPAYKDSEQICDFEESGRGTFIYWYYPLHSDVSVYASKRNGKVHDRIGCVCARKWFWWL